MKKNFVKEKLFSHVPVIGIWSIINSPITVDIAANAGLDFLILDMEHGISDFTVLDNAIRACETTQCSPLIRVSQLNQSIIQNCLDLGAHGLIVPQLTSYNEALQFLKYAKFPPEGLRGFNPFTRANYYNPHLPLNDTKLNNKFGLTSIIIENKQCYSEIDSILSILDLDILYLGIYDMSFDLGVGGDIHHPIVEKFLYEAIEKINKAGKFVGLMVKNGEEIKRFLELGVSLMVYGVDSYTYYKSIEERVATFRHLVEIQ